VGAAQQISVYTDVALHNTVIFKQSWNTCHAANVWRAFRGLVEKLLKMLS
jgi:hypothetical protein